MRRRIEEETGMRLVDFPSFVNVMIKLSVLGMLDYLKRTSPSEGP